MNTLFLRLEGPLQSWGERGRWSVRDSATEPTKSGVVGLLACALGYGDDERIRQLSESIQIGMRCDREGIPLIDYHTIGGGYTIPQLLEAKGGSKGKVGNPHTEISYRTYLHNASFLVAIQTEAVQVQKLAYAVQSPHWVIFLGRKSCPPSRPLYEGCGQFSSIAEALANWPWYSPEALVENQIQVRALIENRTGASGVRRRHAVISHSRRTFGPLYVEEKQVNVHVKPGYPPLDGDPLYAI